MVTLKHFGLNIFILQTTTGHRCPKQGLQEVDPSAVMSREIGGPKNNLFRRQEVSLSNEVKTKI